MTAQLAKLNTAHATKGKLSSLKPPRRRTIALNFVDRDVELVFGRFDAITLRGRVLSIAAPTFGTAADLLIFRVEDPFRYDRAVSLAEVHSIRTIEHEEV
jgi:hypothetical protein